MLMDSIHRQHWCEMFLQVNNSDSQMSHKSDLFSSCLFYLFIMALLWGRVCLPKPIATLKCSLQLPNQRRCLNQWGGWILTGICNEHQPVGIDVSSPLCVCIHEALRSFRPSPGCSFLSWSRRSTFGKGETCKGVNKSSNPPRNRSTKTRVQRLGAKSMYLSWGGSTDPVDQSQPPWRLSEVKQTPLI